MLGVRESGHQVLPTKQTVRDQWLEERRIVLQAQKHAKIEAHKTKDPLDDWVDG